MKIRGRKLSYIFGVFVTALIFSTFVSAATVIVPAGNPTGGTNRKPLGVWFGYERSAAIYLGSELGMTGGETVTQACWYVESAAVNTANVPAVIYMKSISNANFATATTVATEEAGATQVFNATIPAASFVVGAFTCATLSTPYSFTGPNLEVIVETNTTGAGTGGSTDRLFRNTATTPATLHQTWDQDTTAPTGVGSLTSVPQRPNIQVVYTAPVGSGTVQFSSGTYSGNEGSSPTITVARVGGITGAISVNYTLSGGTGTGGAACGAGIDYVNTGGTLNWANNDTAAKTFNVQLCTDAVADPGETFNVTLGGAVGTTISGTNPAVVTITDVPPPLSGNFNVGTGQTYTSLTNAGGIFQAMNLAGALAGNVTINIVSDLPGETGANTLNQLSGGFGVTIKPSGAARTISGAAPATGGLLGFNGADNITIDGSLSGGTDRSLTILPSNNAVTGGAIYFASGAAGAQGNTVKNLNIYGAGANAGVLLGVTFAGNTFGAVGADNDNNRIENNDIRGAFYGIASLGASAANKDTGLVITKNTLTGNATTGIGRIGVYIVNADGVQITQNSVASVANAASIDAIGIAIGTQAISNAPLTAGGISNAVISGNYVGVVTNTATFSSAGIVLASDATGTNNVTNNMVTGVIGNATSGDIVAGIYVNGLAGSTQNIYHNSVFMTGDRGNTASQFPSYALALATDQPTNVRDNALVNFQVKTGATGTGGESYAFGFDGPAANANLLSNNNDLFVSGAVGVVGITGDLTTAAQAGTAGTGVNQATLAAWQTATTEDAASISSSPSFNSATDLHVPAGSPLVNAGVSVGVTVDYDGQTRDATPDIGADEFVAGTPVVETLYATNGTSLTSFSSNTPASVTTVPITGLQVNETIVDFDLRPASGVIYGIGSTSRVYTISTAGVATQVGTAGAFALSGTAFGVDFNPVPDRIRVISDAEQSLRLNPNDGTLAATDTNLSPAGNMVSAAYDRSDNNPATPTTLFAIDSVAGTLVRIGSVDGTPNSPNGGLVTTIGSLGLGTNLDPSIGFDISGTTGNAYATISVTGVPPLSGRGDRERSAAIVPNLYRINLTTGAATLVGGIGGGAGSFQGLTVGSRPTASGVSVGGRVLTTDGRGLRGAQVLITGPDGNSRNVVTGPLGNFVFDDVEAGQSYVVSILSRRFNYQPRLVQVVDNVSDLDFTPEQ